MTGNPIFGVLVVVSTAVFAVGFVGNVLFWLQGNAGAGSKPALTGLAHLIGAILRGLARASVWRSLIVDSALQRRLWRLSRVRWLMQVGFIWGTVELFFVGSVGNMLAEKGLLPITKDTPAFAVLNEVGSVLILLGVGIALYRRFIAREIQLPSSAGDVVIIALLAMAVLSGILTESARLLANNVPAGIGWYSLLGYVVALAIQPMAAGWSGLYEPVWWVHIVVTLTLVAYLPYSKLFHMFVGPAILAAGAESGKHAVGHRPIRIVRDEHAHPMAGHK